MSKITLTLVSSGIYWLEVAEADLRVLCGCPAKICYRTQFV